MVSAPSGSRISDTKNPEAPFPESTTILRPERGFCSCVEFNAVQIEFFKWFAYKSIKSKILLSFMFAFLFCSGF